MKNKQQRKNLLLKVDPRSNFRSNCLQPTMFLLRDKLITQMEGRKVKNVKHRPKNISLPLEEVWVKVPLYSTSPQDGGKFISCMCINNPSLFSVPLILLYFLSIPILFCRQTGRKKRAFLNYLSFLIR